MFTIRSRGRCSCPVNRFFLVLGSVCKVRTQDPENFDEEVKSLVTAWHKDSQKLFSSYQIHKENPLETRQIMSLTNYLWSCVVSLLSKGTTLIRFQTQHLIVRELFYVPLLSDSFSFSLHSSLDFIFIFLLSGSCLLS